MDLLKKSTQKAFSLVTSCPLAVARAYRNLTQPAPYDFGKSDEKQIVVVGSGMAGLTVAYYLSLNPKNRIVVLERDNQPYQSISRGNGCWFPLDYTRSFTKRPLYPDIYRALFDYKQNYSRIYPRTFFQDWQSTRMTAKYGLFWLQNQMNAADFMCIANEMYRLALVELKTIMEVEGRTADDFGFNENSRYLRLHSDKSVWAEEIAANLEVNPDAKIDLISRTEHPDRFKEEVDQRFAALVPGVKDYEYALYCTMLLLDSGKVGDVLLEILKAKSNVEVRTGADVTSCRFGQGGLVESVNLADGQSIPCEILVPSQGAWAGFDIRKQFGETLPMIQGQGYIIDALYDDHSKHVGDHLLLGNSCYSYSQLRPGVQRMSALCDFGIFHKPYFDEERWDYVKSRLRHDYGWTEE